MKLKLLPIILASMTLIGCGSTQPSSTSAPSSAPSASTSEAPVWQYLDFLSGEKNARFDVFDLEEGFQVSYGNAALVNGTNSLTLNDSSEFSVNKNLDQSKSFNTLIIAETNKNGHHSAYQQAYLGTEGDHLSDFMEVVKNVLVGYERAYIAFSEGTQAKWTKGLNAKMDEFFETATSKSANE